jgi:hypothetical protein
LAIEIIALHESGDDHCTPRIRRDKLAIETIALHESDATNWQSRLMHSMNPARQIRRDCTPQPTARHNYSDNSVPHIRRNCHCQTRPIHSMNPVTIIELPEFGKSNWQSRSLHFTNLATIIALHKNCATNLQSRPLHSTKPARQIGNQDHGTPRIRRDKLEDRVRILWKHKVSPGMPGCTLVDGNIPQFMTTL